MRFNEVELSALTNSLERSHAHITKCEFGQTLKSHLTLDRYEEILWLAWKHDRSKVQIAKNSEVIEHSRRSLDIMRIAPQLLRENYTIAINYAEDFDCKLSETCIDLGEQLNGKVNSTLFLAPQCSNAFRPHFDSVDVFAVQLIGRKSWLLSQKLTDLPTFKDTFTDTSEFLDPLTINLSPEDLLYVPRGTHHSVTVADSPFSLHVSFALNPISVGDVFVEQINHTRNKALLFRIAYPQSGDLDNSSDQQLDLARSLTSKYSRGRAYNRIKARYYAELSQPPGSIRSELSEMEASHRSALFWRREGMPLEVIASSDFQRVEVSFPGLRQGREAALNPLLVFPPETLTLLEFIKNCGHEFCLTDLPGPLDMETKKAIVMRLFSENVLSCKK